MLSRRFPGTPGAAALAFVLMILALFTPACPSWADPPPETPSLVVTTLADNSTNIDGQTSLREAINLANSDPDGSTITFADNVRGTIELTSSLPNLKSYMAINGPGAKLLTINRKADLAPFRLFNVTQNGVYIYIDAYITGLTLSGGDSATNGGAIFNDHCNLRVVDCVLSGSKAAGNGGAIFNNGTTTSPFGANTTIGSYLTIAGCTLSDNTAASGFGGGASNLAEAGGLGEYYIVNSTFSTNHAQKGGGAIHSELGTGAGNLRIASCTFNRNSGENGSEWWVDHGLFRSCVLRSTGATGAIYGPAANLENQGYNLASGDESVYLTGIGDINNTDPLLGPLADNGGFTPTCALLNTSPAINAGDPNFTPRADDFEQRGPGYLRINHGRMDIGAFEAKVLTVTVKPGSPTSVSETAGSAATSVRVTRYGSTTGDLTVALRIPSGPRLKAPATAVIPDGASFVDVSLDAVSSYRFYGTENYLVRAEAPGWANISDVAGVIQVTDSEGEPAKLTIKLNPSSFSEATTGVVLTVRSDRGDTSRPITVTLTSADPRFDLWGAVTIPANKRAVNVIIPFTADSANNGTVQSTITARAGGFAPYTATATIYDQMANFTAAIAPGSPAGFSEASGAPATLLRVSRNTPQTQAVAVRLTIRSGAGQVTVPVTATIEIGSEFVDIPVTAVNDSDIDGTQRVIIDVRAPGVATTLRSVTLNVYDDDDARTLTATLAPTPFYESSRSTVALRIVRNTTDTVNALPLILRSADTRFTLPDSLAIPAGEKFILVQVPFVADALNQGTAQTSITVKATGFPDAAATVTIHDSLAKLTAELAPDASPSFNEAAGEGATTIRISRNTPMQQAVTVKLSLRKGAGQVILAETATIAAGHEFVDVPVSTVDNNEVDGNRRIIVDARATGFASLASASFIVLDNDKAQPVQVPAISTTQLSTMTANAKTGMVTLSFGGPLGASAADASNYAGTVSGSAAGISAAIRKGGSIVELTVDGLKSGATVTVTYAITDAGGKELKGTAQAIAK